MINSLFISAVILSLFFLFRWAFRELPKENWQILGVIPTVKGSDGFFQGINLTFYGFFTATAYLIAVILSYLLLGAVSVPSSATTAILIVILSLSVPASKILARIIEKKPHTASVGAASFVGLLIAPWAIFLIQGFLPFFRELSIMPMPVLGGVIIAYAFGEGIGRLACISFGCCYGKPVDQMPDFLKRIPWLRPFVFRGSTKKIAYAGHLEDVQIFPVQAVTAVLYCATGVLGIFLFLNGYYKTAFLLTLSVTQIWRFLSEFLRADYRGDRKISVYQIMALAVIPYGFLIAAVIPSSVAAEADLFQGIALFKNPVLLIFLQFLWVTMFWRSGRSQVTGSILKFHVHHDKI